MCFSQILVSAAVVAELGDIPLPVSFTHVSLPSEKHAWVEHELGRLHRGELETLALAQTHRADFAILDDLLARRKARHLGVDVIGTLGILLLAHQRGLLSANETESKVASLVEEHGMYLSRVVRTRFLAALRLDER